MAGTISYESSESDCQSQFLLNAEGSDSYVPAPDSPRKSTETASFVALFDRQKSKISAYHQYPSSKGRITALKYGPYDNGHVVLGFQNGSIAIQDSVTLEQLLDKDVFPVGLPSSRIAKVAFDPTHLLLATSVSGEVAAISLVESKVKYTYLDLGKD